MKFQLAGTKWLGSKVTRKDGNVRIAYDLTEGQAIVITYRDGARFTQHPAGTGYYLPVSYEYLTVRHDLPYAVTMTVAISPGKAPRVVSAGVSRKQSTEVGQLGKKKAVSYPAPDSIKSDALRTIPVGRLLQDSLLAATHTSPGPEGVPELMVREKEIAKAYSTVVRGALLPRKIGPGGRLDDAHYEQVAKVYRQAVIAGDRPTEAVKHAFSVATPTAARYVMEARRRHFLGPAPGGGKSGEVDNQGGKP